MTQELLQEDQQVKPSYNAWLASLKAKVESARDADEEEYRWKLRYGKT
jgi:hypothetical protein